MNIEDLYASNPKKIVKDGYNQIAETYLDWIQNVRSSERKKYTEIILTQLLAGSALLELGCGTGLPTTQTLAKHYQITGVDLSERHIELAQKNVPQATFHCGDMTKLDFPTNTFDAIAAFYSLGHIPRNEMAPLLKNIAQWLKPNGLFVASFGTLPDYGSIEPDWLGAPMYWSSHDAETNQKLVRDVGLHIIRAIKETDEEFEEPVTFLWVVARKSV
ncbi:MAG: class I SAM-dependent methyltransferase [Chloroflexota bacterium]